MSLADEQFVSVTTFRRNGVGVPTPVWITGLGDGRIGFYTSSSTGKVGRIGRDPRVVVQPCARRGQVLPGSAARTGVAEVASSGADYDAVQHGIRAKYGLQVALFRAVGGLVMRRKGLDYGDAVVVITLDD